MGFDNITWQNLRAINLVHFLAGLAALYLPLSYCHFTLRFQTPKTPTIPTTRSPRLPRLTQPPRPPCKSDHPDHHETTLTMALNKKRVQHYDVRAVLCSQVILVPTVPRKPFPEKDKYNSTNSSTITITNSTNMFISQTY